MDKKVIFIIFLSIIAIMGLVLAITNTLKIRNSEWVCIAQECQSYAEGSDWVQQNCKLGENSQMMCEFQYDGQNFRIPLSGVNTSAMVSCKEYKCSSKVLISYVK